MSQSGSKILGRLMQAQQERLPVVIRAVDAGTYDLPGYVVAKASKWIVVHTLEEGFFLDDLALIRLEDVKKVKAYPNRMFASQVIAAVGVPIGEFECDPDVTTSELLRKVAERAKMVCLNYQEQGHRWREVGFIREVGSKRLEFHGIGDDGAWFEDSGLRRVKNIKRIEFGGRYLAAYERFGQDLPPPSGEATKRIAELVRSREPST